jgi:hypothetical protein
MHGVIGSGRKPGEPARMTEPVTVPFNSEFITAFSKSTISNGNYIDLNSPVRQLVQVGSGIDAELGNFDIYLTCCWSLVVGSQGSTEGYISDTDGNILNFMCKDSDNGVVFTPDFPYDQTFICSEFEFTGGTRRFEGASGRGTINCEVKKDTETMVHHWAGTLTLVME